jgi:FkbM family methyltransferase
VPSATDAIGRTGAGGAIFRPVAPPQHAGLTPSGIGTAYQAVRSFTDVGEEYERVLRRVFQTVLRPGDLAIDVGAHVGKHTVPMAMAVAPLGQVVAVEPIPWAAERLADRLRAAGLAEDVTVVQGCCGSRPIEAVTFHIVPDHPGWSSLQVRSQVEETKEVTVRQTTLDDLRAGRRVRCLKIDVEGAEVEVLAGARGMLEEDRPVVHIEVSPDALDQFGNDPGDIHAALVPRGYRLLDLLGNDVTELELWDAAARSPGLFDFVAVHADDPDLAAVSRLLARSFGHERLDLSAHGAVELLPRLEDEPPRMPAARAIDDGLSILPRYLLDGPSTPRPSVWPGGGNALGRFTLEWTDHGAILFDLNLATCRPLDQPASVELPVTGGELSLPSGRRARIRFDTRLSAHRDHQTLMEVFFLDGSGSAVARLHRNGALELLWIVGGATVKRAGLSPGTASTFDFELRCDGDTGVMLMRVGRATRRISFPIGEPRIELTIGRRAHWTNPEPMVDESADLVISLDQHTVASPQEMVAIGRERVESVASRALRVPGARDLAQRLRRRR